MKKNSQKRKFGTILLSLAALFAVLFSTAACKTDSDDDELNSVTISPSEATINANGQTSLFANVDKKGSGTPVYKWEITSGSDYATLENETSSICVVTGKNTTASAQSVKVKCTVTFASTTKEAEATVTVSAAKAGLESVSIAGSAEIGSTANTELTATPAFTIEGASPTVIYTWEITDGGEYAELSESATKTVTLTAKNTDTAEHEVTVKVTAAYDGTTKEATKIVKILAAGQVVENKVTSVTVSASKDSIDCDGSTTLTAIAEYSGTPTITYTWEITDGGEYAELSESATGTVTLTAKNTTTAEQTVTVKVTATYDGTTKEATTTVKILAAGQVVENKVTSVTVSAGKGSIDCDGSTTLTATAKYSGTPTITYTWTISGGSEYADLSESTTGTVTLTGKNTTTAEHEVTVKVSASDGTNSAENTCTVTVGAAAAVETGNVIKASDTPIGFVVDGTFSTTPTTASAGSYSNPVTTRAELIAAISKGGLIYIKGMIDMTDTGSGTMIPTVSGDNYVYPAALDTFVSSNTSYKSYSEWKSAYISSCKTDTNDESYSLCSISTLYKKYKLKIQLNLKSNTTLIGLDSSSGIIGGTISISSVSNVAIRNLVLKDAYDPFPHHESNDGWNSQYDGITVQGTCSGIWIDHCTFKDSLNGSASTLDYVTNASGKKEHWNPYDGQCDIKGTISSMTVSYCKFMNHDKTMLLCSGTNDTGTKNITLAYNYFYGCKQRLPMVGIANLHIFNNYFAAGDGTYSSNDYAIGLRYSAQVVSENNSFSSWIKNAYKDQGIKAISGTSARLYSTGDSDSSQNGNKIGSSYQTSTRSDLFAVGYSYSLKESSELETYIPANAGAGVWTVVK